MKPQTPLSIFIAVVAFCRPLAATIYAFTDWSRSGTFNPAANFQVTPGDRYMDDFFTPDAWNCQLEDYINDENTSSRLENLCREGTGARTITLGITVLSAVVLYGVVWRTFRRHQATKSAALLIPQANLQRTMTMKSTASDERTVFGEETKV